MTDADYIRKLAFDYWNWNEIPPPEYQRVVWEYIQSHPDQFKGAVPQ